jgi:hypothetical protein
VPAVADTLSHTLGQPAEPAASTDSKGIRRVLAAGATAEAGRRRLRETDHWPLQPMSGKLLDGNTCRGR